MLIFKNSVAIEMVRKATENTPISYICYAFSQVTGYNSTEEAKHEKQDHSRSQQRSKLYHLCGLLKGRHYRSQKVGM